MSSQRFSEIGGHPAVDFVNTRPMRNGAPHDLLESWNDVVRWAAQFGLIDGGSAAELARPARVDRVRNLRDAATRIFERPAKGETAAPDDVTVIDQALPLAPRPRLRTSGDGFDLDPIRSVRSTEELIGALALLVAEFLAGPNFPKLKQCASDQCVLWFVDTTRNHSRHWCRMDRCGARAKSAAYYQRSKKKGPEQYPGPSII